MKCKIHPYTNLVGVCAACLRERLLFLAAAQNQSSSPSPSPPDHFSLHRLSSASPAISAAPRHHHLFFRTPQVGPSSAPIEEEGSIASLRKNRSRKFSLISTLFGNSKSEKEKHNSTKSKSWISNLVHKSRKSKSESLKEINDSRQSWRDQDRERGLSPDRDYCGSPNDASISESSWRPSPSPMRRSAAGGYRRRHLAASGFTVCLSPLVRPSPAHRRSQGAEAGCSGDLRSPAHQRHVAVGGGSIGPSLCHNRSRKIADIGRLR